LSSDIAVTAQQAIHIRTGETDAEAEYVGADISECGLEAYPEFVRGRQP
jgi:hypothetical protein